VIRGIYNGDSITILTPSKTASTSLRMALRGQNSPPLLWHMGVTDYLEWEDLEKGRIAKAKEIIVVFRNPVDRILSALTDRYSRINHGYEMWCTATRGKSWRDLINESKERYTYHYDQIVDLTVCDGCDRITYWDYRYLELLTGYIGVRKKLGYLRTATYEEDWSNTIGRHELAKEKEATEEKVRAIKGAYQLDDMTYRLMQEKGTYKARHSEIVNAYNLGSS